MKLEVGLLNVPTVANSAGNHVNPGCVGMVDPADGRGWDQKNFYFIFSPSLEPHPGLRLLLF